MVVFTATKSAGEYLVQTLRTVLPDIGLLYVYGNSYQDARVETVGKFPKREARVQIVPDVAASGIDLLDLDVVIFLSSWHTRPRRSCLCIVLVVSVGLGIWALR